MTKWVLSLLWVKILDHILGNAVIIKGNPKTRNPETAGRNPKC